MMNAERCTDAGWRQVLDILHSCARGVLTELCSIKPGRDYSENVYWKLSWQRPFD